VKPFNDLGYFETETKEQLRRQAIRSAGVSIVGSAGNFAVSTGSVVVLARLLSPSDFGIVTMVSTISLLLRSFGVNGFTELIVQRETLTDDLASNLFWINSGIAAIIAVAFACSGRLLAMFYHNAAAASVTVGMSLTILIGSFGYIHSALLQRAMHFKGVAIISFAGQSALVVVSILLAIGGFHYWALVWGSVTQTVVTSVGSWLMCRWAPRLPRRASGTGSGFVFAMNVYAHYAFSYMTRNTDNLLVGWRCGAQELGFYKKAYDLFVLPETQLLAPLTSVVVNTLSRLRGDLQQFERYFLRTVSVLALVGLGVGADLALVGKDLIRLVLGPGWGPAGQIFSLFGPGIGVMLLYYTHGWIHLSIGRPGRWLYWGVIEFVCTVTMFVITLHWGPSGVAFAWTASYFLLMFPGFWYAGRPIGLKLGSIIAVIWKFFVGSAFAGIATFLIMRLAQPFGGDDSAAGASLRLVTASVIFSVLYLLAVIVLHKGVAPIQETLGLARDLVPARMIGSSLSKSAVAE
jgi:O-antigen/teichoic acid export membrane protein